MSTKRGRKCSLKTCTNYQHTHKHLSFFRFPKDIERCKVWIEKTRRFDLLSKANVHDERICQQHFEPTMFLNETQNRLQSYAIPTLYLTGAQPHISVPTMDDLRINGFPNDFSYNKNTDFNMEIANVAAKAAMLYQNNLTITPVFASQLDSIQLTPPKDRPISDLLTLKSLECINLSPPITPKANEKQLLSPSPNKSDTEQLDGSPVKSQKQNDGSFRRPRQIFTMQQETELADYVRDTSNYYSGVSSKEVGYVIRLKCLRVGMNLIKHRSIGLSAL